MWLRHEHFPVSVFHDVSPPFKPVAINHSLVTLLIVPHNRISKPSTTHTKRISNGAAMEFDRHLVETHMRKSDLMVMYNNDPVMVEDSINTMDKLLFEYDKYEVVGFDLTYTSGHAGHDQKIAVAQLCVHRHVVLYHYCVDTVPCEHFTRTSGLPCQKLVDIRGHYKIRGSNKNMDSHVDLVDAIIDP
ncbi:hypothetical protein D1007_53146 [Hordeum vulgare]|nr:hypothetical protein D1007_53146 [Hordeum vulgare]